MNHQQWILNKDPMLAFKFRLSSPDSSKLMMIYHFCSRLVSRMFAPEMAVIGSYPYPLTTRPSVTRRVELHFTPPLCRPIRHPFDVTWKIISYLTCIVTLTRNKRKDSTTQMLDFKLKLIRSSDNLEWHVKLVRTYKQAEISHSISPFALRGTADVLRLSKGRVEWKSGLEIARIVSTRWPTNKKHMLHNNLVSSIWSGAKHVASLKILYLDTENISVMHKVTIFEDYENGTYETGCIGVGIYTPQKGEGIRVSPPEIFFKIRRKIVGFEEFQ